ncbi:MAG: 4Fe-4S cluster-binding domain-containing protein [Verrucomicrobiota bacterium]
MNEPAGIVFDIQRTALHDGPGIRTTVFLKGCHLRCCWCHNPESWEFKPQQNFGREMNVAQVMAVVRRDVRYYARSGGGLTVSGGEPTAQFDFCLALLTAARRDGIHTCLDTGGYAPIGDLLALLPMVDLFLWDYKATGAELHEKLTGVSPELILDNFDTLYHHGAKIRLRCPLVPAVNDSPEHFAAIRRLRRQYPRLDGVDLLPYHASAAGKYDALNLPRPAFATPIPEQEALWKSQLAAND